MSKDNSAQYIIGLVEARKKIVACFLSLLVFILPLYAPLNAKAGSSLYFPHTNHQGSVIAVTDENGEVVSQNRYYPYGDEKALQGNQEVSERKYTSQIKDTEADLYYYNARYYDPLLGIFISADSINDQLNRYAYVGRNPISHTDPTGNQTLCPGAGVGTSVSGIAPCALADVIKDVLAFFGIGDGSLEYDETYIEETQEVERIASYGAPASLLFWGSVGAGSSAFCSMNPERCGSWTRRTTSVISDALTDTNVTEIPWDSSHAVTVDLNHPALSQTVNKTVEGLEAINSKISAIDIANARIHNLFSYYGEMPEEVKTNFLNTFDKGAAQMGDLISNQGGHCFVQSGCLNLSMNELGIDTVWLGFSQQVGDKVAGHAVVSFLYRGIVHIADPVMNRVYTWAQYMESIGNEPTSYWTIN